MSCLLPQFKCSPDTFAVNFKSHSLSSKRDSFVFRTQCILSTTSTPTLTLELEKLQLQSLEQHIPNSVSADRSWKTAASTTSVLELEKLKLPSLDTNSLPVSSNKPWSYFGAVSSSSAEATLGATLPTETLITSEEAVIAAAASEALALAKAAVKFAKDAAMMVNHIKSTNSETSTSPVLPKLDTSISGSHHLAKKVGTLDSKVAEIGLGPESDDPEPSTEELEFREAQLSNSIAVTSNRQTERKARRSKAAEKAAANIVSVKSDSKSRKKRSSVQEVDYSDPLRYLRGTTSTSRLLNASEEQVLSEGIQHFPFRFYHRLPSENLPAIISCNGKTWNVIYRGESKIRGFKASSWKNFVDDNNLQVGDALVFEHTATDDTKVEFKVHILRSDIHPKLKELIEKRQARSRMQIIH